MRLSASRRGSKRRLLVEFLERRDLLASDPFGTNSLQPFDVTRDGTVSALDALRIINAIGRTSSGVADPAANVGSFIDVSGDGLGTALDALQVINAMGRERPLVAATLHNDSAPGETSNLDLLTRDYGIDLNISVADLGGIPVYLRVDGSGNDPYAEITDNFIGRRAVLTTAQIDMIAGASLADGDHSFDVRVGELGSQIAFTLTIDRLGPSLTGSLAEDTGASASDGITSNSTFAGSVTDAFGLHSVSVVVDNIAQSLSPGASGEFSELQNLSEGDHTIQLTASDLAGNVASLPQVTRVTVDRTPPDSPTFDLSLGSDSGLVGDQRTSAQVVTLIGQTSASARVSLVGGNRSSLAALNGTFQIPSVSLLSGDNSVLMLAEDVAGNSIQFSRTLSRDDTAVDEDPVLFWNAAALESIRRDASTPLFASRTLAILHAAVFDVVANLEGTPSRYVALTPSAGVSLSAAVSGAAYEVLAYAYPAQRSRLDALLADALSELPVGPGIDQGLEFGSDLADALIRMRESDGWSDFVDYLGGSEPGQWLPTAPMFDVALLPQWANVVPFVLSGPDQFRPSGPPSLTSEAYADAYNEVRRLGTIDSVERTADQTQIARFWGDGLGTYTPPGHWNQIAEQVATTSGNSLSENARLFAALNLALGDAAIAAWDAKYAFEFWRPITAIQNADSDGNELTAPDSSWQPLLISPPFPEYVSGHSTFSGAAAEVLTQIFGDDVAFVDQSLGLPGVQRSFESFSSAADEAGRSRIYGGIHFDFSNQDGLQTGRELAAYVMQTLAIEDDTQPPRILLDADNDTVFGGGLEIKGQVLDNLSGALQLEFSIDSSDWSALAFDERGRFVVTPPLQLDGTSDGLHQLSLVATDAQGNRSDPLLYHFTLDTQDPTIAIDLPLEGSALNVFSRLSGAADSTGSSIVRLGYQFSGQPRIPIAFEPNTGAFDVSLDLSRSPMGSTTLTVLATDAAGHTTSVVRNLQLDALVPFSVQQFTPDSGAIEIGSTFRPHVFFTRPVDPGTLTDSNFFATGTSGAKLDATIVPAADGSFAWLFISDPMPGQSRITIHVDGSTILAASDGVQLDADRDGTAGGLHTYSFATVSRTPLAGTSLSGKVLDPGADLMPMTQDDVLAGADGASFTDDDVFLNPLAGVKVFILGLEDQFVFTDSNGEFHFDAVPSGNVKLAVDGNTATNAPAGFYFPEMVLDLEIDIGVANTVMATMGTREEREANRGRQEVYLPRLRTEILQTASATENTVIGVDATSAPNLTAEQRLQLNLEVTPGSAIGLDGQLIAAPQIGISTVPPELVRDMLPPGLLQHTFDITIQAPEVAVFNEPLAITFPNVFNAAPGTQLAFLSFDHTTGRLVIQGTMTVSEDGLSVTSDPGMGVTNPGWFGMTPPGGCGGSGGPPPPPPPPSAEELVVVNDPIVFPIITSDVPVAPLFLTWSAPEQNESEPGLPPVPGCAVPPHRPADSQQPFTNVTIQIDGPLVDFMKTVNEGEFLPLVSQSFTLSAGTPETKNFSPLHKLSPEILGAAGFKSLEVNRLYGAKVVVTTIEQSSDGSRRRTVDTYYFHRYLDATDANHTDGVMEFEDTLTDGIGGVERDKLIEMRTYADGPEFIVTGPSFFEDSSGAQVRITFDPATVGEDTIGELKLIVPDAGIHPGLQLRGDATPKFRLNINTTELMTVLASIADGSAPGLDPVLLTQLEREMFDTEEERQFIADLVLARSQALLSPFADGIDVVDTPGANTATVRYSTGEREGLYGTSGASVGGDGVDDVTKLTEAYHLRNRLSQAERNFRLAEALQQGQTGGDYSTSIATYVDTILEVPEGDELGLFLDTGELVVALAYINLHEVGHTFGLIHSAQAGASTLVQDATQEITITGGQATDTFQLTFNGATTAALARSASVVDIKIALEGLATIGSGNVTVSPIVPGHFAITFRDKLAGLNDLPVISGVGTGELLVVGVKTLDGSYLRAVGREGIVGGVAGRTDIMMGGSLGLVEEAKFQPGLTADVWKMASKLGWSVADANAVFAYIVGVTMAPDSATVGPDGEVIPDSDEVPAVTGPNLVVTQAAGSLVFSELDFGTVTTDGAGGAMATVSLTVRNAGTEPLVINRFELVDGSGHYSVNGLPANTTLAPGATTTVDVSFDPTAAGPLSARIAVVSNDPTGQDEIILRGFGQSVTPFAVVQLGQNNLGGATPGQMRQQSEVLTLTNHGAAPLTISAIALGEGSEHFALTGVPTDLGTTPIQLSFGESFSFGASFAPTKLGLIHGGITITTDAPGQTTLRAGVVGTGVEAMPTAAWGRDFVVVTTQSPRSGESINRQRSDTGGNFNFVLPVTSPYQLAVFDPQTGLIAHGFGTTAPAGRGLDMTASLVFSASTAPDTDGDGLPDDIELAIGSSVKKADTDGDGLSDFVEIEQGLVLFGGRATGVVANVSLLGQANEVVLEGSTLNAASQLAYVATGAFGLAIVDASRFQSPIVLSQLDLPGNAVDVAVDSALGVAAVATGDGGLHLINVFNPSAPQLMQTIDGTFTQVEVIDGIAYTSAGADLVGFDLLTGEQVDALTVIGGSTITSVAREGSFLYTMDDARVLRVTDLASGVMVNRGTLPMPDDSSRLFVGGGVAYIAAEVGANGGFATANVSNPDNPVLISGVDSALVAGRAIAVNGSAIAVAVGSPAAQGNVVQLIDVSNPANTADVMTQIILPDDPQAIAIGAGIAFIADGTGGLVVANYLPFDTFGQPPTASIAADVADVDPGTPGVQVLEGTSIAVSTAIADDIQVRNVELIVNGQVVRNDVSFPFDLVAIALDAGGLITTIQLRATDTGGNTTLSNLLSFQLVPDTFAPTVVSLTPADDSTGSPGLRRMTVKFSESMNAATLVAGNFSLMAAGTDGLFGTVDDSPVVFNLQSRRDDRTVQLTFASLPLGRYRVTLDASTLTDRAGNALGVQDIVSDFALTVSDPPFDIVGVNPAFGVGAQPTFVATEDVDGDGDLDVVTANLTGDSVSVLLLDGEGGVDARFEIAADDGASAVALGDLNGDGFTDMVVANRSANTVSVLLGNGDGTFGGAVNLAVGAGPRDVALGDVDGDGDLDFVSANYGGSTLSVLRNNGAGVFGSRVDVGTGSSPRSLELNDVDGDGDKDLLVANFGGNNVSVLRNNGTGTFGSLVNVTVGAGPRSLVLADVDGDGDKDFVTANFTDNSVSVLRNDGAGTFGSRVDIAGFAGPTSVAIGDLDGDGDGDLTVINLGGNLPRVLVLRNDGAGMFGPSTDFAAGSSPYAMVLGDLDGDGDMDAAVANYGDHTVSLLSNDGSGKLGQPLLPMGTNPVSVSVGDLNGDGDLDIVTANVGGNNVSVRLSDGFGSFGPVAVTTVGNSPRSITLADVDGDSDLDIVTANYASASVSVLRNNGAGVFSSRVDFMVGTNPQAVALARLDGDSDFDLVTANATTVSILMNDGLGAFGSRTDFSGSSGINATIAFGDVDGDTDLDIAAGRVLLRNDGAGGFGQGQASNPLGNNPALGDIDGDGDLDLLSITSTYGGSLGIVRNDGTGDFHILGLGPAREITRIQEVNSQPIAIGDVDGDGDRDVIVPRTVDNVVSVYRNDGAGHFGPATGAPGAFLGLSTDYSVGAVPAGGPRVAVLGDLDVDGDLDLVAANYSRGDVAVLRNDGDGGFGLPLIPLRVAIGTTASTRVLATGDLNGDGALDFVSNLQGTLVALLADGAGGYVSSVALSLGPVPNSIVLGDLDVDGDLDMVVATLSGGVFVGRNNGAGAFTTTQTVMTSGTPLGPPAAAVGDVNGDGKLDIVATLSDTSLGNFAGVSFGNGDGSFALPVFYTVAATPLSVSLGDIDGDGDLDIVTANSTSNSSTVLLNDGQGIFGDSPRIAMNASAESIAVGDIDGDGDLDLVLAVYTPGITVLRNNGTNVFTVETVTVSVGTASQSVVLGDLDGDGDLDVMAANFNGNHVSRLLNDGTGAFGSREDFAVGLRPLAVVLGDVDGDGDLDFVSVNENDDSVSVLLNDGTATFGLRVDVAVGDRPQRLRLGDVDGDDDLDIATINRTTNDVTVLRNDGTGTFGSRADVAVGSSPFNLALGDLNGDGNLDLVTTNAISASVTRLLNDGTGNFGSRVDTTVATNTRALALSDIDGDGDLDVMTGNGVVFTRLLNDGASNLGPRVDLSLGASPTFLILADIDADGDEDLISANVGVGSNSVSLLKNNGAGTFAVRAPDLAVGAGPQSVALGDVNGDGRLDIVTANLTGNSVSVLLAAAAGGFMPRLDFGVGLSPRSVVLGDIDGDGDLDIVTANSGANSNSVSILVNNGIGGFLRRLDFVVGSRPPRVIRLADVDGDGDLDIVTASYDDSSVSVLIVVRSVR